MNGVLYFLRQVLSPSLELISQLGWLALHTLSHFAITNTWDTGVRVHTQTCLGAGVWNSTPYAPTPAALLTEAAPPCCGDTKL